MIQKSRKRARFSLDKSSENRALCFYLLCVFVSDNQIKDFFRAIRNPQSTEMQSMPLFFAVSMSTSVSPI